MGRRSLPSGPALAALGCCLMIIEQRDELGLEEALDWRDE